MRHDWRHATIFSYLDGLDIVSCISIKMIRSREIDSLLVSLLYCTILAMAYIVAHAPVTPRLKSFIPSQPLQRHYELVAVLIYHGTLSRTIFRHVFFRFSYWYPSAKLVCSSLSFNKSPYIVSNWCIACFTLIWDGKYGCRNLTVSLFFGEIGTWWR